MSVRSSPMMVSSPAREFTRSSADGRVDGVYGDVVVNSADGTISPDVAAEIFEQLTCRKVLLSGRRRRRGHLVHDRADDHEPEDEQ